jgi:hypothetical protein
MTAGNLPYLLEGRKGNSLQKGHSVKSYQCRSKVQMSHFSQSRNVSLTIRPRRCSQYRVFD